MSAIDEIAAERKRQIEVEGWDAVHDDAHTEGAMALAAACHAFVAGADSTRRTWATEPPYIWPIGWARKWWKPKDPRRFLIRAGALIVAEIERLDRAVPSSAKSICPKCSAIKISTRYEGPIGDDPSWYARKYNPVGKWPEHEYMHRTCERCGYDWPEAVAAASP